MPIKLTSFFLLFIVLSFFSCKTYYIPVESFKQQFIGMDSSKMRQVVTVGPLGGEASYKSVPIDTIYCVDKSGLAVKLINSPAIEIRFTDESNKKTVFYFDRISVDSSSVTGVQSRIITSIRKTIPISSIQKIEVQNGKKHYSYVK